MTTIKYSDPPSDIAKAMDEATPVQDFLPDPSQLVLRVRKEKVTMNIDADVLEHFRANAQRHSVGYQSLINEVLSTYKDAHNPVRV